MVPSRPSPASGAGNRQRASKLKHVRAIPKIVWCAVALVSGLGCRQIVGFDEEGSEAGRSELPPLPFVPDAAFVKMCGACARVSCSAERAACEADATCRALLRCRGACSNPACLARCGSYEFRDDDAFIATGNFGGEQSPLLTKYVTCVGIDECASECNAGRNWECTDDPSYRWPTDADRRDLEAPRLRIEVVNYLTANGVPARVSAIQGDGPSGIVDRQQSDLWGQAELQLNPTTVFAGYLEVLSAERGGVRTLIFGAPIFRPTQWRTFAMPATKTLSEPGRATLVISIHDCVEFKAPRIGFELPRADGEVFYGRWLDEISFDASQTDENGAGGVRNLVVEAENYTVIARRNDTEVARRTVVVRPDWYTFVRLVPREAQ